MSGIKGGMAVNGYIERRAAIDAFWPVDPENDGSDGCTVVLQNQRYSSDEIESIISGIPAADVRPVVRGRWSWCSGNKYRCTNCGRHTHVDEVMEEPAYNYCPYCGADMRGGTSDG